MLPLLEMGTHELVIELVVAAGLLAAAAAPYALRAMARPRGAAAPSRPPDRGIASGRGDATPFSLITIVGSAIAGVVAIVLLASVAARALA